MIILLGVLAAGVALGLARGGSLRRLGEARLHLVPVVLVGVALQGAAAFTGGGSLSLALAIASYLAVFGFALANRHRPGIALLALGAFLNLMVVTANGAMPVSHAALARAGVGDPFTGTTTRDGLHEELTPDSRLRFLADVIPLRAVRHVVSPGDLALWAGMLLLAQGLAVGPRGRRVPGASGINPPPPADS